VITNSPPSSSPSYVYWECAFAIAVGPRQIVLALAPFGPSSRWAASSRWSGGLLRYRAKATVSRLAKRFNASVNRAGTLRLD
jgi:hypothetical protein